MVFKDRDPILSHPSTLQVVPLDTTPIVIIFIYHDINPFYPHKWESVVRQLVRSNFRRSAKDYLTLHRSRKPMGIRLEKKQIDYVIRECKKGRKTSHIAEEMKVSQRRVQQLWREFRDTGKPHIPQSSGRGTVLPSKEQVDTVLNACRVKPAGVARTAKYVRNMGILISYNLVYKIMKEHGMVTPSAAKSRRRKWIRYERKYSNAMWHVDWHIMKDQRFHNYNLITYLGDASRCVVSAAVFKEATSENTVMVLRRAIEEFGAPAAILSDNGSCFVGVRRKMSTQSWTPTMFESELLDHGIELINARPYHPQTNGVLHVQLFLGVTCNAASRGAARLHKSLSGIYSAGVVAVSP